MLRILILQVPQKANPQGPSRDTYKGRNPASPHYLEQEWSHFDQVFQRRF